ncbi:MAG: hypothetical protein GDA50_01515, partial [Alphaproteobacteria bacterium GM202ARS2]|nr:hypothetical protein [Alphaproteobacteria bacterium GM202ARS2]
MFHKSLFMFRFARLRLSVIPLLFGFVASCSSGGDSSSPLVNPAVVGGGVAERVIPTTPTTPTDPSDPSDPDDGMGMVGGGAVTLRGSTGFSVGSIDPEFANTLREDTRRFTQDDEDVFGFGAPTPTQTQERSRFRFEYGNQPSFERIGAGIALYDRSGDGGSTGGLNAFQDGGIAYDYTGAGSTISYITDRRHGRFTGGTLQDTVGVHPEFALARTDGDTLVRVWVSDIGRVGDALPVGTFDFADEPSVPSGILPVIRGFHRYQTTSDSGVLQVQISLPAVFAFNRVPAYLVGSRTVIEDLIANGLSVRMKTDTNDQVPDLQLVGYTYSGGRLSIQTVQAGYTQLRGSSRVYIGDSTWTDADVEDVGMLALIRGLVNPEDSDDAGALSVATHGLASGASLRILTTHGLRETGNTVDGVSGGVREIQGGVNLYDSVLQAGAGPTQRRGNVILLDNRLAATDISQVLAYENPEAPSTTQLLRIFRSLTNGTFTNVLADYFVRNDVGAVVLRKGATEDNRYAVSRQNEFAATTGSTLGIGGGPTDIFTRAQGLELLITGRYGLESTLRYRGDRGTNIIAGLTRLQSYRHASRVRGDGMNEYDALIFAGAEESSDIGLFAGLPFYLDEVANRRRTEAARSLQRALRSYGREDDYMLEILTAAAAEGGSAIEYTEERGVLTLSDANDNQLVVRNVPEALSDALSSTATFAYEDSGNGIYVLKITVGGTEYDFSSSVVDLTHAGHDVVAGTPQQYRDLLLQVARDSITSNGDTAFVASNNARLRFIQGQDAVEFEGVPRALFTALDAGNAASFVLMAGGVVGVTLADGTTTFTLDTRTSYVLDAVIRASTDVNALEIVDRETNAPFVFENVPTALIEGLDARARFEFVPQTNRVVVTLGDGRAFTLEAPETMLTPLPHYLAVVAAERGEGSCGALARDYCIAAPGRYNYRDPGRDGYNDNDRLATAEATSRAAAALVASGFAVLQEIFAGQLDTAALLNRVKVTAAQNFDLDADGQNDYVQHGGSARYGHGLFDMECASRPSLRGERCARLVNPAIADNEDLDPQFRARFAATAERCGDLELQFVAAAGDVSARCVTTCPAGFASGAGFVAGVADNVCIEASRCLSGGAGVREGACNDTVTNDKAEAECNGTGELYVAELSICFEVGVCQQAGGLLNIDVQMCVTQGTCLSSAPDNATYASTGGTETICVARSDCADTFSVGFDSATRRCVAPNNDGALCLAASNNISNAVPGRAVLSLDGTQCLRSVEECIMTHGLGYDPEENRCVEASFASCSVGYEQSITGALLEDDSPRCVDTNRCTLTTDSLGQNRRVPTQGAFVGLCISENEEQERLASAGRGDGNIQAPLFGETGNSDTGINSSVVNLFAGALSGRGSQDWQRQEHQNQPSLMWVRAAHAYGYGVGENDPLNLGQGQTIRVITGTRFDPTHPEFDTSDAQELVRLYVRDSVLPSDGTPLTWQQNVEAFFTPELRSQVRGYSEGLSSDNRSFYFSLPTEAFTGESPSFVVALKDLLRDRALASAPFGTAQNAMVMITDTVSNNDVVLTVDGLIGDGFASGNLNLYIDLRSGNGRITLLNQPGTSNNQGQWLQRLGQLYANSGGIVSHEIVVTGATNLLGTMPSSSDVSYLTSGIPELADDAQMGLLALIAGLRNPNANSDEKEAAVNTHGIAPEAALHVYTSPKVGNGESYNPVDLIARARGMDVIRNTNPTRDIVLIQNVIAVSDATPVTQTTINAVAGLAEGAYNSFNKALTEGTADTATQDIFVFAAQDGRGDKRDGGTTTSGAGDVGFLAAIPALEVSGSASVIRPFSIVVVAAERYQSYTDDDNYQENSPCGALVQAFCIAAPGSYTYRARGSDNVYDDDDTLATAVSANAAASLVAGGIALIGQIFPDLSSAEVVARILSTASKTFDLNGDGDNDYLNPPSGGSSLLSFSPSSVFFPVGQARFGVGLLDLACATSPVLRANDPRCNLPPSSTPITCLVSSGVKADGSCATDLNRTVADCIRTGAVLNATGGAIAEGVTNIANNTCVQAPYCLREPTDGVRGSSRVIINGRCLNLDAKAVSGTPQVFKAAQTCRAQGLGEGNYLAQNSANGGCMTRAACEAGGFEVGDPENSGTERCVIPLADQVKGCADRYNATPLMLNVSRTRCVATCEPTQGVGTLNGVHYCKIPQSLSECQASHPFFEGTDGEQGRCVATAADCAIGNVLGVGLSGDRASRCVPVAECIDAGLFINQAGNSCTNDSNQEGYPLHATISETGSFNLAESADFARNQLFHADTDNVVHYAERDADNNRIGNTIGNVRGLIAKEYQNQPSLQTVRAADTYLRRIDSYNANQPLYSLNELAMGQGAHISYITNTLFDPAHPEFSPAAQNVPYDVLTRLTLADVGINRGLASGNMNRRGNVLIDGDLAGGDTAIENFGQWLFARDTSRQVRFLNQDFATATFVIPVGLEAVVDSSTDSGGRARSDVISTPERRAELLTFFRSLMGGAAVFEGTSDEVGFVSATDTLQLYLQGVDFSAAGTRGIYISLSGATSLDVHLQYVGRAYQAGNLARYQLFASLVNGVLQNNDGTNTDFVANTFADDSADRGVMALINGLINPSGSTSDNLRDSNTHGIAPGARLSVLSVEKLKTSGDGDYSVARDVVDQARDRDIGRGGLNPVRNIVILSNTFHDAIATGAVGSVDITDASAGGHYKAIYDALSAGVEDTATQDVYVFAASDGRGDVNAGGTVTAGMNDVGIFAGMANLAALRDYSIVVVAAERYQSYTDASNYEESTPCGAMVQAICISAPGAYRYRDKSGGSYADTLSDGASANAAAALVGGGLALLESLFGDSVSSQELVARVLSTASQNFDLSGASDVTPDGVNDYTDESGGLTKEARFGVGLLDLACAARPLTSRDRDGCDEQVARVASACAAGMVLDSVLQRCVPEAEGCRGGRVLLSGACVAATECVSMNMGVNEGGTACESPGVVSAGASAEEEAAVGAVCARAGGYYLLSYDDTASCQSLSSGQTIEQACSGDNRNLSIDGTICYVGRTGAATESEGTRGHCPLGQGVVSGRCVDVSTLSVADALTACGNVASVFVVGDGGFDTESALAYRGYDPIAKTCVNRRRDPDNPDDPNDANYQAGLECSPGLRGVFEQSDAARAIRQTLGGNMNGAYNMCAPEQLTFNREPADLSLVLTGVDDAEKAEQLFTGVDLGSALLAPSSDQERIAWEHRNQPSLVAVRAAGAYGRDASMMTASLADLQLGMRGRVSYVTTSRFDPSHPEFSSSRDDAVYRTLTRFELDNVGGTSLNDIYSRLFAGSSRFTQSRLNSDVFDYEDGSRRGTLYSSVPIPPLALSDFGSSRALSATLASAGFDESTIDQLRSNAGDLNGLLRFFAVRILGGSQVREPYSVRLSDDNRYIEFDVGGGAGVNRLDITTLQMLGRVYTGASNIRSYQIVITSDATAHTQSGGPGSFTPRVDAADMGVMTLINGLLNPDAGDGSDALTLANTHGVAPGAVLDVVTTPAFGEAGLSVDDLVNRMTVSNDRANLDERNIVLMSNTFSATGSQDEATQTAVDSAFGNGGAYRDMLAAMRSTQRGVRNARRDVFVFAAADGRSNDVGIFASMGVAGVSINNIADTSIVVVAAEEGQTPCGSLVTDICIAAPGAYRYRNKVDGEYQEVLTRRVSANAAAALVAGGFALLEDIFGTQITSAQMVALVLATAAKNFDLDRDGENDYVDESGGLTKEQRFGAGLLDLHCATRPGVRRSSRAGCNMEMVTLPATSSLTSQAECQANRQVLGANGLCVSSCANDNIVGSVLGVGITGRDRSCVSVRTCLQEGLGATTTACSTSRNAATCAGAGGLFSQGDNTCIEETACPSGRLVNSAGTTCLAVGTMCAGSEGVSTASDAVNRRCVAMPTVEQCQNRTLLHRATVGCVSEVMCRDDRDEVVVGGSCVAASATGCAKDGGRGFDMSAGVCRGVGVMCSENSGIREQGGMCLSSCSGGTPVFNASDSMCITEQQCRNANNVLSVDSLTCFANGVDCPPGQGVSGNQCTATASNDNCQEAGRFFESSACVTACGAGRFAGDGAGSRGAATCYSLMECATAGGGRSARGSGTCTAASASTCYNLGDTYFLQGSDCVTTCSGGTSISRSASNMNTCISATDCFGTTINGAVVNGVCEMASGPNCGRSNRVFSGSPGGRCIASAADCLDEGSGLGYDGTDSCVAASAIACRAGPLTAFFDGNNCVNACDDGDGARGDFTCTATRNDSNCMNAGRSYNVATMMCNASTACGGSEFKGVGTLGTNSCYTETSCIGAMGGRATAGAAGGCVVASGTSCFNAGATTYYYDDTQCVETCSGGELTRSRDSMNTCVTTTECNRNQGAVRSTTQCVTASAQACQQDNGMGFNSGSGQCVAPNGTSCNHPSANVRFDSGSGRCVASCAAGEGVFGVNCVNIATSKAISSDTQRVMACAAAGRLYDAGSGTATCVDGASNCNDQCVAVSVCVDTNNLGVNTTRMCVAATPTTCRQAGTTTYYHDIDDGCVRTCSDTTRNTRRALTGGNECISAATCGRAHSGGKNGVVVGGNCLVASATNCTSGGVFFNVAETDCVDSCISEGEGLMGGVCVAASGVSCYAAGGNDATMGFYDVNDTRGCVQNPSDCNSAADFGESVINDDGDRENVCVSACTDPNQGANSDQLCIAARNADDCDNVGRVYQGSQCQAMCSGETLTLRSLNDSTCVADSVCGDAGEGVRADAVRNGGGVTLATRYCSTANATNCFNAGAAYFFQSSSGSCVTSCTGSFSRLAGTSTNECIANATCQSRGRAVVAGNCAVASASNCFADGGRGFRSGTGCVTADRASDCSTDLNYQFDSGRGRCVVGSFVDITLTGITDRDAALALFTGDASTGTALVKNIRSEYQAQDSFATIGVAQAYVSGVPTSNAAISNLSQLRIGNASQISVVTTTRFDPTHPEFSSAASSASFDTLTRFRLTTNIGNRPAITLVFGSDDDNRVRLYDEGFTANSAAYVSIRVSDINSAAFEAVDRSTFDSTAARRTELATFLNTLTSGSSSIVGTTPNFRFMIDSNNHLILTSGTGAENYQHIGRFYTSTGNVESYELVVTSDTAVREDNNGDSSGVPALASAQQMGLLALINGLLDGQGGAGNTHGVAPGAILRVLTSVQAGASGFNPTDLIYRARGIDVARDRSGGNVIADSTRNIVLIQNTLAASSAGGAVGDDTTNVDALVKDSGVYKDLYAALTAGAPELGVLADLADRRKQDIFVFAAADGRGTEKDAGLLAALPASFEGRDISLYSVVAVAVESAANAYCGTLVARICVAAPGAYKYRTRTGTNYNDALGTATATSNAAAS